MDKSDSQNYRLNENEEEKTWYKERSNDSHSIQERSSVLCGNHVVHKELV